MRYTLLLVVAFLVGCASTPPAEITTAIQGNLESLQLAEKELLPLIANGEPIDFGTGVKYRPRDGWRIALRSYQVRAASLVAWSQGEEFDTTTAIDALVRPAIEQARENLKPD